MGVRVFVGVFVISGSWISPNAAAETAPAVRLPQVVVTERTYEEIEPWRYVRTPNFEILSQTDDAAIDRLLERLEVMPLVVKTIWPVPKARAVEPMSIVMCASRKVFRTFVPGTVKEAINDDWVDRLFLKDGPRKVLVLDCDRIGDEGQMRDILREYARTCLSSFQQPPPDWFVTGMAEVIVDAESLVSKRKLRVHFAELDKITIRGTDKGIEPSLYDTERPTPEVCEIIRGAFNNRSSYEMMAEDIGDSAFKSAHLRFNQYFGDVHYHPPLADVLRRKTDLNPDEYRMTCWALVHMCAFARNENREHLRVVLEKMAKDPNADVVDVFQRSFGRSIQSIDAMLADYSVAATCSGVTREADFVGRRRSEISAATADQVGRLKSIAYHAAGFNDLAEAEVAKARRLMASP